MNREQVLVAGATGFIGRHVTAALLARGDRPRLLVRDESKARDLFGDRVDCVLGALPDPVAACRAVEGCARVYHVAGCYRFGSSARTELFHTNAGGTEVLADEARRAGVRRILYVGTAGFLHQERPGAPPVEMTLPPFACYKLSKLEAERRLARSCGDALEWVVASPTCPMGPGDDAPTPTGRIVRNYLEGRYRVGCDTGLNLIHVADLADGILAVMERGTPGHRHVLGHENMTMAQILEILARDGEHPAPRHELPHAAIDFLGWFGELGDRLLPGLAERTQLCRETAWQSRIQHFFQLEAVWEKLAWRPERGAVEALKDAARWQQKLGSAPSHPAKQASSS